jgi:2',3'-cyclic-nucleotide 2'-phosphodiesterase / 3'-nucleotidase
MYEYENYLYTMSLTGQEVLDFLEYSYGLWFNEMQDDSDHLLRFRLNNDGSIVTARHPRHMLSNPFYNFDSAAGIKYQVDVSKPVGSRVQIL